MLIALAYHLQLTLEPVLVVTVIHSREWVSSDGDFLFHEWRLLERGRLLVWQIYK
jgi:hypothetical protein